MKPPGAGGIVSKELLFNRGGHKPSFLFLGGLKNRRLLNSSDDLNNISVIGTYYWHYSSRPSNSPGTDTSVLAVLNYDEKLIQISFEDETFEKRVWVRHYFGVWTSWCRVDNFGCSTAADLATLLGVVSRTQLDNNGIINIPERADDAILVLENSTTNEVVLVIKEYTSVRIVGAKDNSVYATSVTDGKISITITSGSPYHLTISNKTGGSINVGYRYIFRIP